MLATRSVRRRSDGPLDVATLSTALRGCPSYRWLLLRWLNYLVILTKQECFIILTGKWDIT